MQVGTELGLKLVFLGAKPNLGAVGTETSAGGVDAVNGAVVEVVP